MQVRGQKGSHEGQDREAAEDAFVSELTQRSLVDVSREKVDLIEDTNIDRMKMSK